LVHFRHGKVRKQRLFADGAVEPRGYEVEKVL